MACLEGKWQSCPELRTGYDKLMEAMEAPQEERDLGKRNPVVTLDIRKQSDGTWFQRSQVEGLPKAVENVFKSGEEFTTVGFDGKQTYRCCITVHPDKFTEKIAVQRSDGSWLEWDMLTCKDGDMLTISQTYKDATSVMKFKKI